MNIAGDERRAFAHWLRTGRYPPERTAEGVELKHNPWHDPDDGRFTYKNSGRHEGSWGGGGFKGGGGGTFRGGGATARGSWGPRSKVPAAAARPRQSARAGAAVSKPVSPVAIKRSVAASRRPTALQSVTRNGYTYKIDDLGRTRSVSGRLRIDKGTKRAPRVQRAAGGTDRRKTDHGGHFIARQFAGPTAAFNHFAQDASFNRQDYANLERRWAEDLQAGKEVKVLIKPTYLGGSHRPSKVHVVFWVDGRRSDREFPNEARKQPHGK